MNGITQEQYEHLWHCAHLSEGWADDAIADSLIERGLVTIRDDTEWGRLGVRVIVITPQGRTAMRCYEALHGGAS